MNLDPNSVVTREDFARFVEAFRDDLRRNPEQWENASLERFLSALSSYAEDVPGYLRNTNSALSAEAASWPLFAVLLSGAKVYE